MSTPKGYDQIAADERAAHNEHMEELLRIERERDELREQVRQIMKKDNDVIISYAKERHELICVLRSIAGDKHDSSGVLARHKARQTLKKIASAKMRLLRFDGRCVKDA